jgi:hypothetical protein
MDIRLPVSYLQVSATGAVKTMPGILYGLVPTASATGVITIYDNATAASGTIIYTGSVTAGTPIHFGGVGITVKNGIFFQVNSGTATVNVLFT